MFSDMGNSADKLSSGSNDCCDLLKVAKPNKQAALRQSDNPKIRQSDNHGYNSDPLHSLNAREIPLMRD